MLMVKITTDGRVLPVDLRGGYQVWCKEIGADFFQMVRMNNLDLEMLVDEEGLCKSDAKCNPLASVLYGTLAHGQPIMGDVLVVKDGLIDGEPDIVGLTSDQQRGLVNMLTDFQRRCVRDGIDKRLRGRFDGSTASDFPIKVISFDTADEFIAYTNGEQSG